MLINFGRGQRRRSRRTQTNLAGCVQSLETKALLAGTVLINVTEAGDITITGDNKDNLVEIDFTDEGVFVSSDDNRTKIVLNGENLGVIDEGQLILEDASSVRSITANMKSGDDFLDLQFIGGEGSLSVEIAKNIDLKFGNGDDELAVELFDGDVSLHVLGSFKVDSGSGSDFIDINDNSSEGETIEIGGDLSIKTGSGSDAIEGRLQAFSVGGNVSIETSSDSDYIAFELDGPAQVGGNLTVTTGEEDDAVSFWNDEGTLTVDGNATFNLGGDDDVLLLGDAFLLLEDPEVIDEGDLSIDVDGDLIITAGGGDDVIGLASVSVGRDLKIDTSNDDDVVGANDVTVGRDLSVKTGSGDDLISAEDIYVERSTILDAGTGSDGVVVMGLETGNADNSKVDVKLGSGDDAIEILGLTLGEGVGTRVSVNGGSGDDDIFSDAELDDDDIEDDAPIFNFEGDDSFGEDIFFAARDAISDAFFDEFDVEV